MAGHTLLWQSGGTAPIDGTMSSSHSHSEKQVVQDTGCVPRPFSHLAPGRLDWSRLGKEWLFW